MQSLHKKKIRGTKSGVWALPPITPQTTSPIPSPTIERRANVRHFCDIGALVDSWPAKIHDISRGGVKIIIPRRFEIGAVLKLEVPILGEENPYMLLARVVRIVPETGGSWCLGCAFLQEIPEEELQGLLIKEHS
jgi:hypothetical protein